MFFLPAKNPTPYSTSPTLGNLSYRIKCVFRRILTPIPVEREHRFRLNVNTFRAVPESVFTTPESAFTLNRNTHKEQELSKLLPGFDRNEDLKMSADVTATQASKVTLGVQQLEKLIRKVVHEELVEFASRQQEVFKLHKEAPLYEDMVDISERRKEDKLKFHTHEEVWGG